MKGLGTENTAGILKQSLSRRSSRTLFFMGALLASATMALTSGCASGGFKLTRQYAGWVNSQNVILRVVLYILTSIVFIVTLLVDAVVNNTMDFWEGRVSQGIYDFKDGDKSYHVKHEILPGTLLKRSTIFVSTLDNQRIQEVILGETVAGEIEVFIDGKLRGRVDNISKVPVATSFDENGLQVGQQELIFAVPNIAAK